jgi:outer membrane protein OmpA-like peptidoglycan-associated protein/tetratricopeptide (TPR) repeat protein
MYQITYFNLTQFSPNAYLMKVKLILSLLAVMFFSSANAQNEKLNAKKLEKAADEHFRIGEYHNALQYYYKLDSLKPNDGKTNYYIGYCIFNTEQKSKSLTYFQKAKGLAYPGKDLDLYLARSLHLNHKFDKAIAAYRAYVPAPEKKKDEIADEDIKGGEIEILDIKENVQRFITMCENGKKFVADSLNLVIENMGPVINSKYSDFVPVVSANETELIFTSRRPNTIGGGKDPMDGQYYEDLYISTKASSSEEWGAPQNMGAIVNTDHHDACVALSPAGDKLFIYKADFTRNGSGDIYESILDSATSTWSKPKKLGEHVNSGYRQPSATISKNEKLLFFSSNKPGGYGGTDLYVVKLQEDGTWGESVNLGSKVNSEYDEDAPYIHPDNKTLFFSSRGHNTMGGFDVFTTTLVQTADTIEWSTPENAGYPINTADDDIYFIWSADGTKGYFSSWRDDSYGEKDLYVIQKPKEKPIEVVEETVVEKVEETQSIVLNNVFFDFDKATLRPESDPELEKVYTFLSQYPELKVELSGHTDARGSDKYNEKLSKKRAQAVVAYMINKGIDKNRLVAKGYGESKPLESNDTDEGRQINRRTELKVIDQEFNVVNAYKNIKINYKNEFTGEIAASGRSGEKSTSNYSNASSGEHKTTSYSGVKYESGDKYYMPLEQPTANAVLKPKVHFTYKATKSLTEYSTIRVGQVAEIMQNYPNTKVLIVALSDKSGTSYLSDAIAQKRIQTVSNMLTQNGIDVSRISSEIRALDTSNSTYGDPEADIVNRKIEFIIAE